MESIAQQAITTYNEQVQTARARAKDFDISVTLVTFNYDINFTRFAEPIDGVKDLTTDEYRPNGGTPLNDAVAITIEKIKEWVEKQNEKVDVLVCIISDGEENQSKKYPGVGNKELAEIVQTMQQKHGWTFSYAGTDDFDLSKIAKSMNIPVGNVQSFARSVQGTMKFAHAHNAASRNYYDTRSMQNYAGAIDQLSAPVSCFYTDTKTGGDGSNNVDTNQTKSVTANTTNKKEKK
jgi:uncharacterized protein YegL